MSSPMERGMHTTTVRFPRDTWERLKMSAQCDGVAVAQYIREAAIHRLAVSEQGHRCAGMVEEVRVLDVRLRRVENVLVRVAADVKKRNV